MWFRAFRDEGLCGVCGDEPLKDRSMCAKHLAERRRHQAAWYRRNVRPRRPSDSEQTIERLVEELRG